jgi:hypothetical protein
MVIAVVSSSIPSGLGTAATGPALARPLDPSPPVLGRAAVAAAIPSAPPAPKRWPDPPSDPAPLKGLGIPPLNTRQVGDFDRLDAPVPPVARYDATAPMHMTGQLDLRR